jgi:hypothetical protein
LALRRRIDMFLDVMLGVFIGICLGLWFGMVIADYVPIGSHKEREALVKAVGGYFRRWYADEDVRETFEYMRICWEDYVAKRG